MDYRKIMSRGGAYIHAAANNWDSRKSKLIKIWFERDKPRRIFLLACELEDRVCKLGALYRTAMQDSKRLEDEARHQHVILECPSFECQYWPEAVCVSTLVSNYVEGEIKCGNCGAELIPVRDGVGIDDMLGEMGISTHSR